MQTGELQVTLMGDGILSEKLIVGFSRSICLMFLRNRRCDCILRTEHGKEEACLIMILYLRWLSFT